MAWVYDPIRLWWTGRTAEAEAPLDALFVKNIHSDSRILALGPGRGLNLARLYRVAPKFCSYLGIDLAEEMLSRPANGRRPSMRPSGRGRP